jgi:perosamine synthetase
LSKFAKFDYFDNRELRAVKRVVKSGELSGFYGSWGERFEGGREVREFEKRCAEFFHIENAITFNSLASGLSAAVGALGVGPGDEVILPPWTMSATAAAVLHWGGIPIFADIDVNSYCINPRSVESLITPKTKGIIAVDIFGQSAKINELMELAGRFGLFVISDSAQAVGAQRSGRFAGTMSHIGGISLNYHKHIHSGEGAVMFTNDHDLSLRLKLIRNHAESVVEDIPHFSNLVNMVGHNYRMTELQAAIASVQLKKLPKILLKREREVLRLREELSDLDEIILPFVEYGNTHVYYLFAMQINVELAKFSKYALVQELTDMGLPGLSTKYINLHLLPMFQKKIAIGDRGFPWTYPSSRPDISYRLGICPNAERLQNETFFSFYINDYILKKSDVAYIGKAFRRAIRNLSRTSN